MIYRNYGAKPIGRFPSALGKVISMNVPLFLRIFQAGRNLDQFVNFAYSIALSQFRLKRYDEADRLLIKALTNFPQVLKAITDKNSIIMDKKIASIFDKHYPYDVTVHLYAER